MDCDRVMLCDWFVWRLEAMKVLRKWRQSTDVVVDLVDVVVFVLYGRQVSGLDVAL